MADFYPTLGDTLTIENTGVNTYGHVGGTGDRLYFRQWDITGVEASSAPTVTDPESYSVQTECYIGYPQSRFLFVKTFTTATIGERFFMNITLNSDADRTVTAKIYDGEYDYTSTTDFPATGTLPSKGAGLLQTLETFTLLAGVEQTYGTGQHIDHHVTIDDVIDVSSATLATVTLIIQV